MILCYTNDDWRSSIIHLPEAQRLMAARFRATMAGHLAEPGWKMLLKRLRTESQEFREVWDRHEVIEHRGRRKEFMNRYVGHVSVDHTDLWLGPEAGPRMVTYAPADEESRRRLEKLHAIALERAPSGRRERDLSTSSPTAPTSSYATGGCKMRLTYWPGCGPARCTALR